jgi:hypothetical protein
VKRLLLPILAAVTLSCSASCPREDDDAAPRTHTSGTTSADRTYYETNAWNQSFVDFPAGRRWAFRHGLGQLPREITSYLGLSADPLPVNSNGFVAESAGNQVLIEGVDSETIRVRNDTCEHFYLRLVASSGSATAENGGAGGEAGGE